MSAPEQVGKVATSAIDALRGNPGLIALIILQLATLGTAFYAVEQQRQRQFDREMMLLKHCLPGEYPSKSSGQSWWTLPEVTGSIPKKEEEPPK